MRATRTDMNNSIFSFAPHPPYVSSSPRPLFASPVFSNHNSSTASAAAIAYAPPLATPSQTVPAVSQPKSGGSRAPSPTSTTHTKKVDRAGFTAHLYSALQGPWVCGWSFSLTRTDMLRRHVDSDKPRPSPATYVAERRVDEVAWTTTIH